MAFPNVSPIVATTIESRTGAFADNVSNTNALLSEIKKSGGIKPFSGGSTIFQEIVFAENPNTAWYSGADTLALAANDEFSAAQFGIKQASTQVVLTGLELLQNSGKEQFIDLLEAKIDNAQRSLTNLLVKGLYSDGTANSGKQITGLAAAVPVSNATGVYGNIDRATWTFWRNKKMKGGGVDYAGALDKTTIQAQMTSMLNSLQRGNDAPNLIVMDPTMYNAFQLSMTADQRYMDAGKANRGFSSMSFYGIPVVMESIASGIAAGTIYFLNTDFLFLRPHTKRNMVRLDLGQSTNQDLISQSMAWAGNLTSSGPQFQGVIQN